LKDAELQRKTYEVPIIRRIPGKKKIIAGEEGGGRFREKIGVQRGKRVGYRRKVITQTKERKVYSGGWVMWLSYLKEKAKISFG